MNVQQEIMETVLGGGIRIAICGCCSDIMLAALEPEWVKDQEPGLASVNLTPMMVRELIRRLQKTLEK